MRAVAGRWRQLSALALWGLVLLLVGALVGAGETAGREMNHAGLVVTFADGRTERRCVEFAEEEISGVELLRRSGLAVVFSSSGAFGEGVCRIDDTGCSDPGDCFCQCRGADCAFWTYFALEDGEWRFQNVGASQRRLRDGDVDGWVWGSGRTPPEPVTFDELCPLAAAPTQPPPSPPAAGGPATDSIGAQTTPSGPAEAVVSPKPPLPELGGEPASARSTESGMPGATGEARQAAGPGDGSEQAGEGSAGEEAKTVDESGGGPPAGLIAFGAVAGLLAAAIGGLALRRRFGG